MTSTADLTPAAVPVVDSTTGGPARRVRSWHRRTGRTSPSGVLTSPDLVRLAATLSTVAAALAGLSLLARDSGTGHLRSVLHTPYGLVAVGHVTVVSAVQDERAGDIASGNQRLVVPVTLHNLSDEPVHYGPEHFRLHADGATAQPETSSVPTGDVAPGGAVQLRLVFDAPGTSSARLTVDSSPAGLPVQLPTVGTPRSTS